MKKINCCIVILFIILLPTIVNSENISYVTSGTCGDNLTWELNNEGVLTISGSGAMEDYSSGGNAIATPWESSAHSIKTVIIDEGVTSVGAFAFYMCGNLTSVDISEGVTTIGSLAFASCSNLKTVHLPNSIKTINSQVFQHCNKLDTINFPYGLETIGAWALLDTALTSIIIPNSVTNIGQNAFENCRQLKEATISNATTNVRYHLFYNCSITEITIPEGITTIEESAFYGNTSMTKIYIPSTMERISNNAFAACYSLSDVYYTGTKDEALELTVGINNLNLTGVTWHCTDGSLDGLGKTSGTCGDNLTWELNNEGVLTISGSGAMEDYSSGGNAIATPWESSAHSIKTVIIDEGVTSVGAFAFYMCGNLTSVDISEGVTTIGSLAFASCSNLKTVHLPNSIKTINSQVFQHCNKLDTINFPYGLETIGAWALLDTALTSIIIPNSVTNIGQNAFENCRQLKEATISNATTNVRYHLFYNCSITEITIPEGITTIEESAFYGNTSMTKIYIPSTMERISNNAFAACYSLSDVYYPGSVDDSKTITYCNNTYLTDATWHFEYIHNHNWSAPYYYWSEKNAHVTAFRTCSSETSHSESETVSTSWILISSPTENTPGQRKYTSDMFINPVFTIQTITVANIPALTNMKGFILPTNTKCIEEGAFQDSMCEFVIIPSMCEFIGENAFSNCRSLKYIKIPSNINSIAENAFDGCDQDVVIDRLP